MSRKTRRLIPIASLAIVSVFSPAIAGAQDPAAPPAVRDPAIEMACGPNAALTVPAAPIRIKGGEEDKRALFAPGDRVVVNAGSSQGLKPGAEYFIRRTVADRFAARVPDAMQPVSIRTAGWLKLIEVRTDMAIATITYACDSIGEGDYLEPFVMPAVPVGAKTGEPDFANPGHLLMGDERRQMGSVGALMVLDRGSDHGLRAGQRLTIYRTSATGSVVRVGEATAVKISPETSMVRIDQAKDAIYVGDKVAIHR
jgi:hypothetical protein